LTALAGCILAIPVGDYLTKVAHVPEMEGQRATTIFFLCVPLGILASLLIGVIARGVPYLLSDNPQRSMATPRIAIRATYAGKMKIPEQPDGYSIRVSLYIETRESGFAFIDWNSITRNPEHVIIPGKVALLTHSKTRSLLASMGNEPAASQFVELKNLPPAPRKADEAWSDWIFATERADLTAIPNSERFAIRYRVHPIER